MSASEKSPTFSSMSQNLQKIWENFLENLRNISTRVVYVLTMRVVIYDILSMAIIPTLSTSILFCNLGYILLWISPRTKKKKLIHCVVIFTILYGNYYLLHGELKLICIGKFAQRTWVNFTQQYGKNRQRCQQNKFTMLYRNYCYIFIISLKNSLLVHSTNYKTIWKSIVWELLPYSVCRILPQA